MRRTVIGPFEAERIQADPRFRLASRSRPDEENWRGEARCLELDPEVFFPAPSEDATPALRICGRCPVAGPCLALALETGEPDGVWGATTPDERRQMRQVWLDPPRRRTAGT